MTMVLMSEVVWASFLVLMSELSILMVNFLIVKVKNIVQVLQPSIQTRKIAYVKYMLVILELLKKLAPGMQLMENGEPNKDIIGKLVFIYLLSNRKLFFNFIFLYLMNFLLDIMTGCFLKLTKMVMDIFHILNWKH